MLGPTRFHPFAWALRNILQMLLHTPSCPDYNDYRLIFTVLALVWCFKNIVDTKESVDKTSNCYSPLLIFIHQHLPGSCTASLAPGLLLPRRLGAIGFRDVTNGLVPVMSPRSIWELMTVHTERSRVL